ncbi:MAG TPA: hypothetical protein VNQ73_15790 [Ilumatobacter sp.]|nr:hypothetical protein [Ilumatobacter sp.]
MRAWARPIHAAFVVAAVAGAAACGADDAAGLPTCVEAIDAAADEIEVAGQLRRLDDALLRCGSYNAYLAALASHPGLIGYSPQTYVELRCAHLTEARYRYSPTCRVANPPTTPPVATAPEVVYAAATLDGRVVELRPSPAVPFTGDVPAVVQDTVDIAVDQGCPGVLAQRDLWAGRAAAEQAGSADIASVYAQHAIHVALWIGCADAELSPTTDPVTTPPTTG